MQKCRLNRAERSPTNSFRFPVSTVSVGTKSRGFTLLEMLLVVFLMALVASTGLMLTEGVEDQSKYDETKRRMELIRKAIVGDPTRTVNGGPEISGFVADMGRLPGCLRELLEPFDCGNPAVALQVWGHDSNSGIGAGWRGPYISVMSDQDSIKRFRDGYGNEDIDEDGAGTADEDDDAQNFGWVWQMYEADRITPTADPDEAVLIRIKSKGFDGQEGNADDYPDSPIDNVEPVVDKFDYEVNFQNWSNLAIAFENTSGVERHISANSLKLILAFTDGEYESDEFPVSDVLVPSKNGAVEVAISETATVPEGTVLTGTLLSFVKNGDITFNNGSVSVTINDKVMVPEGSSFSGTALTFAAGNVVFAKGTTSLNLVPKFKDPDSNPALITPEIYGQFSLSIVCNDPVNLNTVDDKRFDGDCTRYGTDAVPNNYTPVNQPYLFRAPPRSMPVLPPSPLNWSIQ